MDIILITSSYPLNPDDSAAAAGLFVRDFAAQLAGQGHTVRILTQDRTGQKKDDPSFEVVRYPWRGSKPLSNLKLTNPSDFLSMLSIIRSGHSALDTLCKERHPDLIIAMWAIPAGLFARQAKRKYQIPYRVWTLGSDIWGYGKNPLTRPLVQYALKGAEKVFADGVKLAEDTAQLYGKDVLFLPSSRRLPNAVSCPPELKNGRKNFLFIGRYHLNKGPDLLLHAVSKLDKNILDEYHFTLFGGGEMEDWLRETVLERGLTQSVSIRGYADRETAAAFLEHCHGLVIPSRIESIPVILSDAAQAGCPLVVTDVGDMGGLVHSSGAGIVVHPEPDSLLKGIIEMACREREDFSGGLKTLAETFSLKNSAKRILE